MLVIVDYGVGNLGSLLNMCKHLGIKAKVGGTARDIMNASHLILPGVGAFDHGMNCLKTSGVIDELDHSVKVNKTPILGVCLGMQLMAHASEEGSECGLGWIDAVVTKIPSTREIKVPHMGWSRPKIVRDSSLFKGCKENSRYYFVHSYYVTCNAPADSTAKAIHGVEFDAAFEKDNIFGVQFHPEKSHKFGMKIVSNFSAL